MSLPGPARAEDGERTRAAIAETDAWSARTYAPLPVVLSRGAGPWVWDVEGRRYLDCISAYSSLNHGHCHPRLVKALREQSEKLTLSSRAVYNERLGSFLRRLCELSGGEMALPMNSGAEAVETAIKVARKWGYRAKGVPTDTAEIVVCRNNFHGRTTTLVGFSSERQYRDGFGPYGGGFHVVDFGDLGQLEAALSDRTVGFLLEPIQAEAGIRLPPADYLSAARALCRDRNVLFILDEVQTGLGRTGKLFAFEHERDARPDLLVLGKALGGGILPVSAVVGPRAVLGVLEPGDHGSTFGGNPLAAAVGEAALAVIVDERLPERSAALGARLRAQLEHLGSAVLEVRGRGLLIGIEIASRADTARAVCQRLLARGVLAKDTHRQVIRIAPALTIDMEDIDWLAAQLRAELA